MIWMKSLENAVKINMKSFYICPMRMIFRVLVILLFFSCSEKQKMSPAGFESYREEINNWHKTRISALLAESGWVNLAGLFWLSEGVNAFGTAPGNDIIFPEGSVPPESGYFILTNGRVTFKPRPEVKILINGEASMEAEVFGKENHNTIMSYGTFRWNIIQRENKFGIRLRDLASPALKKFKGVDRFEINPDFIVQAVLKKSDTLKTIAITNVLGQTTLQKSPGTAHFEIRGKKFHLDLIDEENGSDYFIVFSDLSNGKTTYESGRFLYVARPDSEGNLIIDFNKSINPPCAFSPYATCPLPPAQNRLDVIIEAGEKAFHFD